jgi:hypothetical protein
VGDKRAVPHVQHLADALHAAFREARLVFDAPLESAP